MLRPRSVKIEPEEIMEAMSQALINAKQFLKDSKALANSGSVGHATSMAILGFEEAHKSYLLIQLLPIMDAYMSSRQKKDVRKQLTQHMYKLRMGLVYQVYFQYLAYNYGSKQTREKMKEILLRIKEFGEKNKQFENKPLGAYLNFLKNRGFYVDPFDIDGVWIPCAMTTDDIEGSQALLELHISLVQDVVEFYMIPDFELPEEVHSSMNGITRALTSSRGKGLSTLRKELEQEGEAGEDLKGFLDFLEEFYGVKGGRHPRQKRRGFRS